MWRILILSAAAVAFALFLGEVLTRLLYPTPFSDSDIWPGFNDQLQSGKFVPDAELGYRPGPEWLAGGRFGFSNGVEYDGWDGAAVDIAVLGDSLVQSGELTEALKNQLGKGAARVWTAGIGGYNTLQEAGYLERHITREPNVLILAFCLNDFTTSMVVVPSGSRSKGRFVAPDFEPLAEVNPYLFRHSALYRLVQSVLVAGSVRERFSPQGVTQNGKNVIAGLERMQRYAARLDIPFLVILYPHLVEQESPWLSTAHRLAIDIFQRMGLRYVDVSDAYAAHGITALRKSPDDAVHPRLEGHEIAARQLLQAFPEIFDRYTARK